MTVERYPRSARRYHAAIYVVTLLLLATGWWLLAGREGDASPLARFLGIPDVRLHVWLGWALLVTAVLPLVLAIRAVVSFLRETFRRDPGDVRWLLSLPVAIITGRFPRHEGHFDPGQRIANVAIVALLATLIVSGAGLAVIHGGPVFALLAGIHRLATIAFTVVIAGHIVVALGILPGYRGVWRSMHLGGRLHVETARRLWPGWAERRLAEPDDEAKPPSSAPDARANSGPQSGARRAGAATAPGSMSQFSSGASPVGRWTNSSPRPWRDRG